MEWRVNQSRLDKSLVDNYRASSNIIIAGWGRDSASSMGEGSWVRRLGRGTVLRGGTGDGRAKATKGRRGGGGRQTDRLRLRGGRPGSRIPARVVGWCGQKDKGTFATLHPRKVTCVQKAWAVVFKLGTAWLARFLEPGRHTLPTNTVAVLGCHAGSRMYRGTCVHFPGLSGGRPATASQPKKVDSVITKFAIGHMT